MARRIIRTIDGQIFADNCSHFRDRKGYVLYKKSVFRSVRINKRGITSDNISGPPAAVVMMLVIFVVIALVIGFSFLNSGT